MPPLGSVDVLDDRLVRRRMISAAAAHGWAIGPAVQSGRERRRAGFPCEIRHAAGRTWMRRPAARVHAARTLMEMDTLLALGVVPASVGSTGRGDGPGWRSIAAEAGIRVLDVADAGHGGLRCGDVDLAVVSSAVAAGAPEEIAAYERLDIPVLVLPADDVAEQLRVVGEATGLAERAARMAASTERRVGAVPRPSGTPSVAAFTVDADGRPQLLTRCSPLGALLRRWGCDGPLTASPSGAELVPLTASSLRAMAHADVVLGLELGGGLLEAAEQSPWLAAVPAVRAGRYRRLDPVASYAVAAPSVLTLPVAMIVLSEALDGR